MPNRSVSVELKALVSGYVTSMKQAATSTKLTADQVLALSKSETQMASAVAGATAAVKANGATLDQSTAKGRANKQALDQLATATRQHRQTLIATGASQAEVAAATEKGRTAWLSAASAMGMTEAQAKKMSGTLFAASRVLKEHRAELASLGMGLGIVGAGMVVAAGLMVKGFADFDKQMSSVSATGADAKASLAGLRAEAIEAGAATQYSATEAAAGITELIKAGVKAEDVLGGGLDGALNLAAAGQMDVASSAVAMSDALNQFKLPGSQASHIADLLASGANAASGSVSDMSMALSQSGLVAYQTGMSLEETVTSLTMFAAAGLRGSDAGTSLKTMLQRLTPQSAEAAAEFERLGISAYDSQGKFVGLTNFSGQLNAALKDMEPKARNAALQVMFGSDAVRAASVLYEAGASGAQKFADAINQQGFAQRSAAELTNNLTGDVERLGGSLDTVFIQSGSGANNVLRQMAQGAEAVVNFVGQIPEPLLAISAALLGSGGLAVAGVGGMAKLGSVVLDARDNFKAMGLSAKTAAIGVGAAGAAIAVGTIALTMWASAQAEAKAETDAFASTMVVMGGAATRTDATLQEINQRLIENGVGLGGWGGTIQANADAMGVSLADMQGYVNGNADAIARVTAAQAAYQAGINAPGMAKTITQAGNLTGALDGVRQNLTSAEQAALAKAKADEVAGVGAKTYAEAVVKGTEATKAYTKELFESANAALKNSGTQIGWEAALDDTAAAIKKNGDAARTAAGDLDLNTAGGRANQQALDQLASSSVSYAQSLMEQGASEERIEKAMERSRKAFIKQATAAGMTGEAAERLANEYGLIPSDVKTNIAITGGDKSMTKLALVQAAISDLPADKKVEVLSAFDKGGIKAADKALNDINGKHVKTYIDVQAVVYKTKNGRQYESDGGMLGQGLSGLIQQFASGGFGQPQVRPFQGSAGVNWGEEGSGPWEAFISGAPQKRERSIAIWREVGSRLLGSFSAEDVIGQFADGGVKEPTAYGKTLSFWADQLKTPLELTQARIAVRDLKDALREKETYGKGKNKKKRLVLRGLDRTEANQKLSEAKKELDLALKAQKVNADKQGTIASRLAKYEQAKKSKEAADEKKAQAAEDAAQKKKSADDEKAANNEKAASQSDSWQSQFRQGSSLADLLANMKAGAEQMADWNTMMGQLDKGGLSDQMQSYLWDQGPSGASLAKEILAGGKSAIDALNGVSGNLDKAADSAGRSFATGTPVASPVLNAVALPSYMASGSAGYSTSGSSVAGSKSVVFNVTPLDPAGAATYINQQLRYL